MKMKWEAPELYFETFVPNEYVAACWNINCNVDGVSGDYTFLKFNDKNENNRYDGIEELGNEVTSYNRICDTSVEKGQIDIVPVIKCYSNTDPEATPVTEDILYFVDGMDTHITDTYPMETNAST